MRGAICSPQVGWIQTGLELYPERELELPRVGIDVKCRLGCNGSIGVSIGCAWIACVDVVEAVVGVYTELKQEAFVDGEVLLQRQIGVKVARSVNCVPAHAADLVHACLSKAAAGNISGRVIRARVTDGIETSQMFRYPQAASIGVAGSTAGNRVAASTVDTEGERQTA